MKKQFEGIIAPLVTPLTEKGHIDLAGMEKLINYVIEGGVDGVFILGTTGEGPCISKEDKLTLIRHTNLFLRERAKFLVGITDTSPDETVMLSRFAADNGADAAVIAPPPYFLFTQEELLSYMKYMVDSIHLPTMLYNIPKMTKTSFGVDVISRLIHNPKIVGFKDSSKDIEYFKEILKVTAQRPDWSVLIGFEHLLEEAINSGGDGGVLGGANIFPKLISNFYKAIVGNNSKGLNQVERILSANRKIYGLGTGITSSIQAIKYALELKGICSRKMTIPFNDIDETTGNIIRHIIQKNSIN